MVPSKHNPYTKHGSLVLDLMNIGNGKYRNILLLERVFTIVLCLILMLTPAMFVRWVSGRVSRTSRKLAIELYVLLKVGLSLSALFLSFWHLEYFPIIAVICLIDLFSNIVAIVLLRNFWHAPLSLNRTLISLGVNFVEFTAWFAGMYLHFDALRYNSQSITDPISAFYFSVITAATIGFGDIVPTVTGRPLVIAEAFCSFLFIGVVVTYVIGSLGQSSEALS